MGHIDVLSQRITAADIKFIIEPYLRFEGEAGEQKTMFFKDPFGNALEFKSFKNDSEIFKNSSHEKISIIRLSSKSSE